MANTAAFPIVGLILLNSLAWTVTGWVEDRCRKWGWTHFDVDRNLISIGTRLFVWSQPDERP